MRRRILLVIGGTLLVMLLIITVASGTILNDSYEDLERSYLTRDMERIRAEVDAQADTIASTARDYAQWTDLYNYVIHPTAAFEEDNFGADSVRNLRVDVVLVLSAAGRVIFQGLFASEPVPDGLPARLAAWVVAHPDFALPAPGTAASHGIVVVDGVPLIAAAAPVLDSKATLPTNGTVVMARVMGSTFASAVSSRLVLALQLYALGTPLPADASAAVARLRDTNPFTMDASDPATVRSFTLLRDVTGTPAVLVRVSTPRDIRLQGARTVRYFFLWLFFIGAGFAAAVLLTVERTVLSRLVRLGTSVLTIGTGGNPARRITIGGRDQIAYLGAAINGMLDALERSTEELRASERRNEAFLDAVPDVIFRVTRDGTITDARSPSKLPLLEAANDLVGRDEEQILSLYSFLSPEHFTRSLAATQAALDTGVPQMLGFHVDTEAGRRYYEERFVASSKDEAIVLVREVTALKRAEEARRQEVLLKEIHHRVKNNLQVISALLALQARAAGDERTRALLAESRDRLRSMSLIHEKLYQTGSERGVSFAAYVRDLAAHLRHSYAGNSQSVQVAIDVDDIALDLDLSVPCGLVITELLSNALKHAFPAGRTGTVTVSLHRDGRDLVLGVRDDGVGLPAGMDVHGASTLGLRIVGMLVGQLKGTLSTRTGPGASFTVRFAG